MNDISCIYDDAVELNVKEEAVTAIFEAILEHSDCRENVSELELEQRVLKSLRLKGIAI